MTPPGFFLTISDGTSLVFLEAQYVFMEHQDDYAIS